MQFKTTSLPIATYISVGRKLKFLAVEPLEQTATRWVYVFADSENIGPSLEIEYRNGGQVPAAEFQERYKALSLTLQLARAKRSGGAR
jgi:hypothetical protein